ncbi:32067_t:CDS:2, partial [Gigaspora margarita]
MSNFSSLLANSGSKCSNEEWSEYVKIPQVHTNETPSDKKYLEARKLIQLPNSGSYTSEIGIAICFSCDQLNAIKKIKHAREIELAQHYQLLWAVREEIRQ